MKDTTVQKTCQRCNRQFEAPTAHWRYCPLGIGCRKAELPAAPGCRLVQDSAPQYETPVIPMQPAHGYAEAAQAKPTSVGQCKSFSLTVELGESTVTMLFDESDTRSGMILDFRKLRA